jgi:hypothetical protein
MVRALALILGNNASERAVSVSVSVYITLSKKRKLLLMYITSELDWRRDLYYCRLLDKNCRHQIRSRHSSKTERQTVMFEYNP